MLDIMNESVVQKERFRVAANKLLNNCFLLKKKPNTKAEYLFVLQNKELFLPYFRLSSAVKIQLANQPYWMLSN